MKQPHIAVGLPIIRLVWMNRSDCKHEFSTDEEFLLMQEVILGQADAATEEPQTLLHTMRFTWFEIEVCDEMEFLAWQGENEANSFLAFVAVWKLRYFFDYCVVATLFQRRISPRSDWGNVIHRFLPHNADPVRPHDGQSLRSEGRILYKPSS